MERVVNFVGRKGYSKQDGTYIVAEVKFPERNVYVAAIKQYVVVAIPSDVKGDCCYVTYISLACSGQRRCWCEVEVREKEKSNPHLIKKFYEVLDTLEKGSDDDCKQYLNMKYDRFRIPFHTELTQFQFSEIDDFLMEIDMLSR